LAPLLSGLVMPGLGQLMNRQLAKGGLLVAGVSLLFMAIMGLTFYHLSRAITALGELAPGADKWAALRTQLLRQDTAWLWLGGGLFFLVWLYGVIDAWRWGRAQDRQRAGKD
jgi:hypothetical protein